MPHIGIAICPVCHYSLEGLPPPHRCPECGFEYDERTRVWLAPRTWWSQLEYFFPAVAVMMILGALAPTLYLRAGRPVHLIFMACAIICMAWLFGIIGRRYRSERRGQCVAITPRGLFIRNEQADVWIEWRDVGRAVFTPTFEYVTRSTSIRTTPLPPAFADEEEQAAFVQAVAVARMHYQSLAESEANDPTPASRPEL